MEESVIFSIIIPTRNRSQIVRFAIDSVLKQSFKNFELIVVDNDVSDVATKNAVAAFSSDSRLRYFRSGGLPMADNWEFGLQYVRGKYVMLLEDRQVLVRYCLERLHEELSRTEVKVITWRYASFQEQGWTNFIYTYRKGVPKLMSSLDIISNANNVYIGNHFMPFPHHSLYDTDIIRQVISVRKKFFKPIAPDYTACYAVLGLTDNVLFLQEGLTIAHNGHLGNGLKCATDFKHLITFIRDVIGDENYFHPKIPLKVNSVINRLYDDLLWSAEEIGGNWRNFEINKEVYYKLLMNEAHSGVRYGVMENNTTLKMIAEILNNEPQEIQTLVKQYLENYNESENMFIVQKTKTNNSFVHLAWRRIKSIFGIHDGKITETNGHNIIIQKKCKDVSEYLTYDFEKKGKVQ
jgi:glycosyltransferase involved in cell wall biosynthesis